MIKFATDFILGKMYASRKYTYMICSQEHRSFRGVLTTVVLCRLPM